MFRILFICTGNICRSPTAEGVFRTLVSNHRLEDNVFTDSAGTGSWHQGAPPDTRTQSVAASRGYDLSMIKSRPIIENDIKKFDLFVGMDSSNIKFLKAFIPIELHTRVSLLMDFSNSPNIIDVPDPYYGGFNGFTDVLDLIEDACEGLIKHIIKQEL
jgi:protein-tyrosine phosphatase